MQEIENKNRANNHCSCGIDYKLADLGYGYFPRYSKASISSKTKCNGHRANNLTVGVVLFRFGLP